MTHLVVLMVCLAVVIAGLVGVTLSVPLQAPTVVLMGLAGILAAAALIKSRSRRFNDSPCLYACERHQMWMLGLSVLSVGYFALRACFSPVWALGVEDLMLILPAGLLYLLGGYGVAGRVGAGFRLCLAAVVILLLLLHMGAALMQLIGRDGYSLSSLFISAGKSSKNVVTGMYGYRGSFANFSVIAGLLCLSLGVWGRLPPLFRFLVFLLGSMGVLLATIAQSRSAAVSLVAALIVFGCALFLSVGGLHMRARQRIRGAIGLLVALSVIAAAVGGVMVFKGRATHEARGADVAFDSEVRFSFWSMAVEQWADAPVFGAGSRSYSYECFQYWNPNLPTHSGNPEFVHNEYLQLLADYGLVGLLLILGILGCHLFIGFLRVRSLSEKLGEGGLKKGSNAMALTISGVSGGAAMLVHICFDYRTHILANLLLFVCCMVWVLPVVRRIRLDSGEIGVGGATGGLGSGGSSRSVGINGLVGCAVLVMGLGSLGLGTQQFWAGLPLIENRIAKEDGAWTPQQVHRDVWISSLEKSLGRMPHWKRYERLGTLYQMEASQGDHPQQGEVLQKAEAAYLASADLHPYNPVPQINLAMMYAAGREWQKADAIYAEIAQRAVAREHWFRIYQKRGEVHRQWAKELWAEGNFQSAGQHYVKSQDFYHKSKKIATPHDERWRDGYLNTSFEYVYFLLSMKHFDKASELISRCEREAGKSRVLRVRADYLLHYGESLWFNRRPEEAMTYMYEAREKYLACKRWNKDAMDDHWHANLKKTEEIIGFLKMAGVEKAVEQ